MTLGGWCVFVTIALCIVGLGACIGTVAYRDIDAKGTIIGIIVGIVISVGILTLMLWYYGNTAYGSRALKTQQSNFNNGIKRTVKVYDATGDLIQEYTGTFDIEYDDDRILFDDENGLRHVIYYPTGTVIIDEVE